MNRRSFFAAIAGAPVAVAGVAAAKPTTELHSLTVAVDTSAALAEFEAALKAALMEMARGIGEAGPDGLVPLRRKGAGVLGISVRQS